MKWPGPLLEQWLKDPKAMADALGMDEDQLNRMTPEELIDYFKERLKDQDGRHDGGSKWIGTGGTSPVGHSGYHPGGMRVGGVSRNKSAVKVAMERRYKDYSLSGPLTQAMVGEALKRLRNMVPAGPKDQVNIDESIYRTMKNAGEIEIAFDRRMKDRLKVILAIDNGGWSMDPMYPWSRPCSTTPGRSSRRSRPTFSTTPSTTPSGRMLPAIANRCAWPSWPAWIRTPG
jgi:uncharacterized protein with von Willebrand factor type A (vWA) domain